MSAPSCSWPPDRPVPPATSPRACSSWRRWGSSFVQIDRQRKQRTNKVSGGRREYLRYLAGVRTQVREAADRQRRSLTWRFPEPTALPALAEERSRLWERGKDDEEFLQVRFGVTSQALALELVPPESAPIDQLDPVSASALHRLIAVHRVQPDLPAALRLGAFSRVELTGEAEQVRALARALVASATAAHAPQDLLVAVLASPGNLAAWDWVKWLPHAHSPEQNDALGRSRMVSDSLEDVFSMLPPELRDRPRFTAARAVTRCRTCCWSSTAGRCPPGNNLLPEEGLEGITVLDLPASWGDLEDPTRLRLNLEAAVLPDGRAPMTALRLREAPTKAAGDQMDTGDSRGLRPAARPARAARRPGARGPERRHPRAARPARAG